jgi:signal transduction histidine kinase
MTVGLIPAGRLLALAFLSVFSLGAAQAQAADELPVQFQSPADRISLAEHALIIEDPHATLGVMDIMQMPTTSFAPGQFPQSGNSPYWVRIDLLVPADCNNRCIFDTDVRRVRAIEFYAISPAGDILQHELRQNENFNDRSVRSIQHAFRLIRPPDGRLIVFLRFDPKVLAPRPKFSLETDIGFHQRISANENPYFIYYGLAIGLCLYNLILFLHLREFVLFGYIAQSASTVFLADSINTGAGMGFQFLWPNSPGFEAISNIIAGPIFSAAMLIFASSYVDIRRKAPITFWIGCLAVSYQLFSLPIINIMRALGFVLGPDRYTILTPGDILFSGYYLMLVANLPRIWWRGDRNAGFFLIAFSPMLINQGILFLNRSIFAWTGVPGSILGTLGVMAPSSFEMVMMSVALADRFLQERRAREGAQAQALEISRQSEIELSAKIEERTRSLKDAQAQLVQSEKLAALGTLVAGVAHEINTPLGIAVTATSQVIADREELQQAAGSGQLTKSALANFLATTEKGLSIAYTNLTRAADLVRSFKQVAVDQNSEEPREIDLALYVDDILRSLEPVLKGGRIEIVRSIPTGIKLLLQPGVLAQIVTNLVQNAARHAYVGVERPYMTFEADINNLSQVVLKISDNGVGMDAQTKAKAFDPFFTTQRGSGGTGLGLHIVHNLVTDALKGTIQLRSSPGAGTEFEITIGARRV